jgi:hypothetical protein
MAWHRDGSVGFYHTGGAVTTMTGAQMTELNNETDTFIGAFHYDSYGGGQYVGMIFPELRDIAGWFVYSPSQYYDTTAIQTSPDTTTGLDGTWTTHSNPGSAQYAVATQPGYRTNIQTLTLTGKKSFRIITGRSGGGGTVDLYTMHVFGKPSTGQTRYLILTDTGGTEVGGAYFDYGDDPRGGSTEDKTFKVKNGHGSLTANSVTVNFNVLTDKSPSFATQYTFSTDGTTFSSSLSLGNLAPGASSGTLTVRRTTPSNAQLGLETGFILAAASSWS